MEILFILAPFGIGLALAFALRNHLKVLPLLVALAGFALLLFGISDFGGDGEYAGLATIILAVLGAIWVAGMGIGAGIVGVRRLVR